MVSIILTGIAASALAEAITWVNRRIQGTVLKGRGAFLIAFGAALAWAVAKQAAGPGFNLADWRTTAADFGQIFTASQVFFYLIVQKFHLDVQPVPAQG